MKVKALMSINRLRAVDLAEAAFCGKDGWFGESGFVQGILLGGQTESETGARLAQQGRGFCATQLDVIVGRETPAPRRLRSLCSLRRRVGFGGWAALRVPG